jgi:hypothetical protein
MYFKNDKSFLWKKPRHSKVPPTALSHSSLNKKPSSLQLAASGPNRGQKLRVSTRLSAQDTCSKSLDGSSLPLAASSKIRGARNKNSGNHKNGRRTFYPNRAFELANEFKMVLKSQRKIKDAAAEEITPELIELAEQKHREKILKKCEPVKTNNFVYGRGIYDARNEPISNKRIRWADEIEDEENAFWSKKYY